ncbi:MAG: hypothetical protein ACLSBH_10955 [Coprobacillus cateniformis]
MSWKKIPDFTKVIGKKKETIYPLKDGEVEFLKTFGKGRSYSQYVSRIY